MQSPGCADYPKFHQIWMAVEYYTLNGIFSLMTLIENCSLSILKHLKPVKFGNLLISSWSIQKQSDLFSWRPGTLKIWKSPRKNRWVVHGLLMNQPGWNLSYSWKKKGRPPLTRSKTKNPVTAPKFRETLSSIALWNTEAKAKAGPPNPTLGTCQVSTKDNCLSYSFTSSWSYQGRKALIKWENNKSIKDTSKKVEILKPLSKEFTFPQ